MNRKILIILVIAIIIIGGAFFFLQQPKYEQNTGSDLPQIPDNSSSSQPLTEEEDIIPNTYSIAMENFLFKPAEITIKKGDTITWTNQDSAPHDISGDTFQSNPLVKGQSFSFAFDSVGTFNYICGIHPSMKGKIIVQ